MIEHNIEPIFDENSRILILGSFPSVKSREAQFFYGHPQNRFWRVTAAVFGAKVPQTTEEKRAFLLNHGIALWDTVASCDIKGSSDASIKNVKPNDLSRILNKAKIERIFTNGRLSHNLYNKYLFPKTNIPDICLPSTSPANAAFSLERLIAEWRVIASDY